jgi:uncharacterized membrane protein YphA (DoxX/SURF4 family)
MLLSATALFCRLATSFVFGYSSTMKLVHFRAFVASLEPMGLNPARARLIGAAVVAAEVVVVPSLLFGGQTAVSLGFLMAALMLIAFTTVIIRSLRQPDVELQDCLCFGKAESFETIHVFRNLVLLGCVVCGEGLSLPRASPIALPIEVIVVVAAAATVTLLTNLGQIRDVLSPVRIRNT